MSTKPKCKLVGENGNIFNLISIANRALKEAGLKEQGNEMTIKVMNNAKSYDEALQIIMEYVEAY